MDDIVIDTHIVIWYFADPTQLSVTAEAAIIKPKQTAQFLFPQSQLLNLFISSKNPKFPPMF